MAESAPAKPRYQLHERLGIETVAYRGPLERMPTHAHAELQLTLYDGGPRRFNIGRQNLAGGPRASVIIQAGEPHGSVPVGDPVVTLRTFYLDPALIAEVAASLWRGTATVAFPQPAIIDRAVLGGLSAAHRALDARRPHAEEAACVALERLVRRCATPTGAARPLSAADQRVARARELLEAQVAEAPSLDALATAAGLSRFHLIRLFRRKYGMTPFAYQRNLRIERARAALRAGLPIATAAAEAGFADQSHLGRSFRAVMGSTPGEYRASYLFGSG